jgi:hypothetical protein
MTDQPYQQITKAQYQELEEALRDIILECDDGSKDPVERLEIIRYTAKAALLEV